MIFSSWAFAKFFAMVLIAVWIARTRTQRQFILLCASIVFYAHWNARYLFLLATPSVIDYVCARQIERADAGRLKRRWLWASVASNVGLLAYFKYANFFIGNVSTLIGHRFPHLDILLPVGISFYTFKTLSYTIDVYRGEIAACHNLWKYAMFVTYFPELVAGPIVRASVFLPQMTRSLRPSWSRFVVGSQLLLLGLTKKIVVADRMAPFVNAVFGYPERFSGLTIASAVVAYSLQIYCDFSGYSDMAIGISRIIGFDLPENFNMPYLATSVTEFWRRWHITLSSWLRDYLYIPLGGNQKGRRRAQANLMITMMLGGLWHGASWNFVIWGLLHGVGLVVHKLWAGRRPVQVPRIVSWALTYGFVCLTWIFFRAQSLDIAWLMVKRIAGFDAGGVTFAYLPLFLLLPLVIAAHGIGILVAKQATAEGSRPRRIAAPTILARLFSDSGTPFATRPHKQSGTYALLPMRTATGGFVATMWLLAVVLFGSLDTSPFIYFQF